MSDTKQQGQPSPAAKEILAKHKARGQDCLPSHPEGDEEELKQPKWGMVIGINK